MKEMYEQLGISSEVYDFGVQIEASLKERFQKFDEVAEYNQMKVLLAMQKNKVNADCFQSSSGYGYDDFGRDTLEKVYADTFHTEACADPFRRSPAEHMHCAIALFGKSPSWEMNFWLLPANHMIRLEEVIGIRPSRGSLAEYGVTYTTGRASKKMELLIMKQSEHAIHEKTRLVEIQRSKGYQTRPMLTP